MSRANGNPNPCNDLDETLHTHPHLFKEGFGAGLTPSTSLILVWGPETLKAEEYAFFEKLFAKQMMFNRKQINPGSAGYLDF